jgi:hypothetical protein
MRFPFEKKNISWTTQRRQVQREKTALANRGSATDLTGVGAIGRCRSMRVLSMVKYFSSSSTFRQLNSQQGQNGEV